MKIDINLKMRSQNLKFLSNSLNLTIKMLKVKIPSLRKVNIDEKFYFFLFSYKIMFTLHSLWMNIKKSNEKTPIYNLISKFIHC